MASTVGHALCGMSVLTAFAASGSTPPLPVGVKLLCLFAVAANLPDLDMVLGYVLGGNAHAYHGRMTHSILFALVAAKPMSLFIRRVAGVDASWLLVFAAIVSHDCVDLLTGPNLGFHWTKGLPLFWPLSDVRISSPITVFWGPHHDSWDRLFSSHNLVVVLTEIAVFLPILLLLWQHTKGRPAQLRVHFEEKGSRN